MHIDRRAFTASLLASGLGVLRGAEPKAIDETARIAVQFTDTQRFGLAAPKLRDPRFPEKVKLLTRHESGDSNNTVVRIDTYEYVFGRESAGVGIRWKEKAVKAAAGRKTTATLGYATERIDITQTVEIVVGEQTQLYDTALVTYSIDNRDDRGHTVGLRTMIDTYFGLTDGVPLLVAPTDTAAAQLVDTKIELAKDAVPGFLRGLESSRFEDGTAVVAEMGLRLKGCEPLEKVVVCRWPQEWGASEARWDWPYAAMNEPQGREKDSCVVLYWPRLVMKAGEKRLLGFTCGLGAISDGKEGASGMRLLMGGAGGVGKTFVLTAYVKDPRDGDKAKLELPAELQLADGQKADQDLRTGAGQEYAQASWRVKASKAGKFAVTATAGDRKAARTVLVHEQSRFE
jgi:hypothetical protein